MGSPFIEIIECVAPDPNLLAWKFADNGCEIQNGAKLTVRESQNALFICEGQIADVFQSGMHTLKTENIPIFSRLKGWKYGFASPFKADIYFFSMNLFINNKWGTPAPILVRDPEFGAIRVRAFGSFDIRIDDPALFFKSYAGTYKQLTIFELQAQLRDFIAPKFGEILTLQKIPVMEIAGSMSDLSAKIEPLLSPYFAQMGLKLTQFIVASVSLPDEVLKHIDSITNMNMTKDIDRYAEFQKAKAIGEKGSALNDAVTQAAALNIISSQTQAANKSGEDIGAKLKKLKELFENDLIDEAEYKGKKAELLKEFNA
ncbi:MAG: SPFH domain-containing protein [Helicobacteraceae bacterium]|jgi:membrane protease subunit (stomatin/prohibitin family)|nr:SPFH domain-containing protein [Helicobacteraceae bacterium]